MQTYILTAVVILIALAYFKSKAKDARNRSWIERYGEKYGHMMIKGDVGIGMTKEMLLLTFGSPLKTEPKIIKENFVKETYYYKPSTDSKGKTVYLFTIILKNDIITEMRDSSDV